MARTEGHTSTRPWQRRGPGVDALGRSRGECGTKVHVLAGRWGKAVVFEVTGGERHKQAAMSSLMEQERSSARPQAGSAPGRSGRRVTRATAGVTRRYMWQRGIGRIIPGRRDERRAVVPRSRGVAGAECGGAADQSAHAAPTDRYLLPEARGQLPRHAHLCRDPALTMRLRMA